MSQPLAIVGASARAAAASAVRAGFQPIAADLFADLDLRAIATATRISPYPEGLLDWLRAVQPPAWIYTGALENHPELIDQMAWIAPLWGNPGDVLERVRSPWELADALRNTESPLPETRSSPEGLPRDGSWLVKTYRGASGSGVWELVETGRQGDKETRRSLPQSSVASSPCLPLSLSPCLVYQQRAAGTPCSAAFVAAEGAATRLGVTRQLVGEAWLGAHGFQFAGSIGPLAFDEATLAAIARCGNVLAERFELCGLFGVDFIFDGQRLWTLEVNPRYTASIEVLERATGINAIAAHAAACCGAGSGEHGAGSLTCSPLPAPGSPLRMHGKAVLYARSEIVISDEFAAMALSEATRRPWPTLADISPAGTRIEAGRPILTLFAGGSTADQVENQLRERVATLERKLYAD
jgi:predicted ATP-grasp superfamily ATP-dependent carboligase